MATIRDIKRKRSREKAKVIRLMTPWFDKLCDRCKNNDDAAVCDCEAYVNLRSLSRLLKRKTIECDFSKPLTMEVIEYLKERGYSEKDICTYSGELLRDLRYYKRHHDNASP